MKKYKLKKITLISAFITVTASVVTVVSCDLVAKNKKNISVKDNHKDERKSGGDRGGRDRGNSNGKHIITHNIKINLPSYDDVKKQINIRGKNGAGIYDKPKFEHIKVYTSKPSGQLSNGDVLNIKLKPESGYVWSDLNNNDFRNINILIDKLDKLNIDKPTKSIIKPMLNISGKNGIGIYHMPTIKGVDVKLVSGETSGSLSNGDILTFEFTLKNGYVWSDGSRGVVNVEVEVDGLGKADAKIHAPKSSSIKSMLNISGHNRSGTYDMPSFNGADVTLVSGNKSGHLSNGDVLIFKFTLKNGFVWSDGSRGEVSVKVKVDGLKTDTQIAKPTE
ncbi:MAG: hypothetical protein GY679_00725, partial [Mycoplasma sp.]|nr:hypothetical protein [Mycoplasma sp.]